MAAVTPGQATGLPPAGTRKPLRRRASEVVKPACPWCGAATSSVYESRADRWQPVYHRRRQCAECRRDWPTVETLDQVRFKRELKVLGMTLADLGLAPE